MRYYILFYVMRASSLQGIIVSAADTEAASSPDLQVPISLCSPSAAICGSAVGVTWQDEGCRIFPTSYPCPRKIQVLQNYGQGLWCLVSKDIRKVRC